MDSMTARRAYSSARRPLSRERNRSESQTVSVRLDDREELGPFRQNLSEKPQIVGNGRPVDFNSLHGISTTVFHRRSLSRIRNDCHDLTSGQSEKSEMKIRRNLSVISLPFRAVEILL